MAGRSKDHGKVKQPKSYRPFLDLFGTRNQSLHSVFSLKSRAARPKNSRARGTPVKMGSRKCSSLSEDLLRLLKLYIYICTPCLTCSLSQEVPGSFEETLLGLKSAPQKHLKLFLKAKVGLTRCQTKQEAMGSCFICFFFWAFLDLFFNRGL